MINWSEVDTVLLDMDGTLLDLHFDNFFWLHHLPQKYAEQHSMEEQSARQRLIDLFAREQGTLNWYCMDYWSAQLQLDIDALKKEVRHLIAVRPYVEHFLQHLHDSPKEVLLVTNAHFKSLDLKLSETDIGRYFNRVVCSHDFGCPKEDQQFWHLLQQTHPFNPRKTVFIDDSAAVLASAQKYGIRYLLTLLQPDSQLAIRQVTDFPGFHHFDELMPDILRDVE
jgi:putative hydrolase of the HAD superfamily